MMVAAVLAVAVIGLLAVAFVRRAGSQAEAMAVEAALVEADGAADAGLARIMAALADRDDRLAAALSPHGGGASWTFGEARLRLHVRAESGKLDLLAGDPALIRAVVADVAGDPMLARAVLDRIDLLRRGGPMPPTLLAIVPPEDRAGDLADRLGEHLTLVSGQSGFDPLAASGTLRRALVEVRPELGPALARSIAAGVVTPDLAAGLGAGLAPLRRLYAIEAEATLPNGLAVRRGAVVSVDDAAGVRVERRADMPLSAPGAGRPH